MDRLEVLERRLEYVSRQIEFLKEDVDAKQRELTRLTRIKQQLIHDIGRLRKARVTKARQVVTV